MRFTLLLFLTLLANLSSAQIQSFSKKELIADADTLYAAINDIHPAMFANYPMQKWEKEFRKVKASFRDSMTESDFYRKITPLIVALNDGHTGINFPLSVRTTGNPVLFPLEVDISLSNHSMTVVQNLLPETIKIPAGAEIIKINGRKSADIIKKLLNYVSGEQDFYKQDKLTENFAMFYYAVYGETSFDIQYRFNHTKAKEKAGAISLWQKDENKKTAPVSLQDYSFAIDKNRGLAVIEFNRCENQPQFNLFIDSAFRAIKDNQIGNLIIDVRNNVGGQSAINDEFFQYISPRPFQQFGKTIVKMSDRLRMFVKERTPSVYAQNPEIFNQPTGCLSTDSELIPLRTNSLRFNGRIYLLTSHHTLPVRSDFSWAFNYFRMGTVIGEETGGMGVCFGDAIPQQLPNTRLGFYVSCQKLYNYGATDNDTHGTIPDVIVPAHEAMDKAIGLIQKNE